MGKTSKEYQRIIDTLDAIAKDGQLAGMEALNLVHEAMDIVSDYEQAAAQTAYLIQKYETAEMAVRKAAGIYTCPECGKRAQPGHTHCHWCGKKLSWDRESYAGRDYPHMKRGGR
jgi:hypothetical protein